MRSITSYCVWGLCMAADLRDRTVRRAVEAGLSYVLQHQLPTGLWADENNQGVLMPNIGYYYNTTFSTYVCLEMLGAYQKCTAVLSAEH